MVGLDINLLPRKGARELTTQKWLGRLRKGSFIFLGIYALLLLIVFGGRFFLNQTKSDLENQEQQARVAVDALAEVESQHVLVKQKLQGSSRVLAGRKSWYSLLADVIGFIPDRLAVSEISLTREGDFQITVETERLQELAIMLNALLVIGLERDFVTDVSFQRVEKSSNGTYGFTLVFKT